MVNDAYPHVILHQVRMTGADWDEDEVNGSVWQILLQLAFAKILNREGQLERIRAKQCCPNTAHIDFVPVRPSRPLSVAPDGG